MSGDDRPGMLSCVFCERLRLGDYVGHERYVASFEPLNPVTPGHRLFIPHRHVMDAAMAPWVSADVFEVAAQYAAGHDDDFNLITSGGGLASQTVLHLHVHYVPRREGDGLVLPWTHQREVAELKAERDAAYLARIEAQNPGIDLEEVRRQWKDAAHPGIDMAEVQRQRQHRRMVEDLARRGRDAFMASEQPAPLFFGDVPVVDDDEDAGPQERPKP